MGGGGGGGGGRSFWHTSDSIPLNDQEKDRVRSVSFPKTVYVP